jgi:hypothetical protein
LLDTWLFILQRISVFIFTENLRGPGDAILTKRSLEVIPYRADVSRNYGRRARRRPEVASMASMASTRINKLA